MSPRERRAGEEEWINWRPRHDSNVCCRLEKAVSWAGLDDGDAVKEAAESLSSFSQRYPILHPSVKANPPPALSPATMGERCVGRFDAARARHPCQPPLRVTNIST